VKDSTSNNDDTLSSLDEAIREFHSLKDNLQWVSGQNWPARMAESTEEAVEELLPVAAG
jgi:hypothetical protein